MSANKVPAIEVRHLTVSYGARPALLDVSVTIEQDQLVGVIGPNGSGKSTFIKAILGFEKPDVGEILIGGEDVQKAKGKVAYVPQRRQPVVEPAPTRVAAEAHEWALGATATAHPVAAIPYSPTGKIRTSVLCRLVNGSESDRSGQ